MREGADPAASMSISGYLSASDAFDITEAPQYYDVFMDPLGSSYQESDLQGPVYGQPSFSPVSVPFSTYGPPGAPVCSPPYPYGHQCLEYPCDPEMEPQNPLRGSLLGLPVIKRPRMGPGARVKGQDELCVVCGDKASGYHYNALTCEGCKGFFRRSVTKKAVYRCKSGGSCEMDMYMRRKCQDCRLRKCRAVGMLAECLLTEVQCQSKRLRKGSKYQDLSESRSVSSSSRFSTQVWSGFSREQRCFLNRIVEAYRRCVTQDDTLHRVPLCWGVASSVDLTPAQMEKLQQFLRSVPGFELLESCDQVTLLCCSSVEVMFLLLAQQFSHNPAAVGAALCPTHLNDTNVDWMKTFESKLGHRILTHSGLKDELLGCVLHFLHTMFALGVTEAEYALLTATAVLCSDRPCLRAVGSVENLQELVLELLSRLCCGGGQRDPRRFARLLGRLTELRTLRHNHLTQQPPWDAQA